MIREVFLLTLLLPCAACHADGEGEPADSTGVLPFFEALAERLGFPWAKPLADADMDLIERLLDTGILSDREADWYVQVPEGDDGE
jgi:hypothetical protein